MGQVISGDLADLIFWLLAELHYAEREYIQSQHNILLYTRYRDDILVIFSREPDGGHLDFMRELRSRASDVYEIKLDGISRSCDFLDVELFLPGSFMDTGFISYKPFTKPTSQKVTLSVAP